MLFYNIEVFILHFNRLYLNKSETIKSVQSMKSDLYTNSRRDFIQKLALSSAILAFFPQISFGKSNQKGLKIGIMEVISGKTQAFDHLLSSQKLAYLSEIKTCHNIDILYISNFNDQSLETIQEASNNNIFVMIERPKKGSFLENKVIHICQNAGVMLAIVEDAMFDKKNQKAFNKTDLYESAFTTSNNLQRSLDFIKLLDLFTEKNNFRIYQSIVQASLIV